MTPTLLFPEHHKQTQSDMVQRAMFVAFYASLVGKEVRMIENTDTVFMNRKVYGGVGWVPSKGNILSCEYNGKQIVFEFSDFPELGEDWMAPFSNVPVFKFHYSHELHGDMPNVFPIGPCMILPSGLHGFKKYYSMRDNFEYSCSTDLISNRQEPRRLALERRTSVQNMLKNRYGVNVDLHWQGRQESFWKDNEHVLASVCVPGACNNMLDRGHYELLGLGVCTISPHIPTILPWADSLVPDAHYIQCKDDYSDLIDKIEWSRENRDECVRIGRYAKELFDVTCTPVKYWDWIDTCVRKVYN